MKESSDKKTSCSLFSIPPPSIVRPISNYMRKFRKIFKDSIFRKWYIYKKDEKGRVISYEIPYYASTNFSYKCI